MVLFTDEIISSKITFLFEHERHWGSPKNAAWKRWFQLLDMEKGRSVEWLLSASWCNCNAFTKRCSNACINSCDHCQYCLIHYSLGVRANLWIITFKGAITMLANAKVTPADC